MGIQVADSACNSRMEVLSATSEDGNPEWKWKTPLGHRRLLKSTFELGL